MANNGNAKNSGYLVPITVAIIGLIGTLGAVLIDKLLDINKLKEQTVISPPSSPIVPKQKFTIVGTWLVYEPNAEKPLTSITLSSDNQYQGGSWGRDFTRDAWTSNGLDANRYTFDGEVLSFNSRLEGGVPGIEPQELSGNVKVITPTEIEFTVTGGFFGGGQNLGKVFRLRK